MYVGWGCVVLWLSRWAKERRERKEKEKDDQRKEEKKGFEGREGKQKRKDPPLYIRDWGRQMRV